MGFGAQAEQLRRFACDEEADLDPFFARCREIDEAIERGLLAKVWKHRLPRSAYTLKDRPLRRLVIAEALAKAGFNPDEPRDELGRWTTGGDNSATVPPEGRNDTPTLREGRSVEAYDNIVVIYKPHVPRAAK